MPNRLWTLLLTLTLSGGATAAGSSPLAAEEIDPEIEVLPDEATGTAVLAERPAARVIATPAPLAATDLQLWASHDPGIGAGWTARLAGEMVGELNLVEVAPHHGLVDALWAAPEHEERVTAELLRAAVEHAHTHGLLKLTFDTRLPAELTLDHLGGHGLRFSRLRRTRQGGALDFYLDLHRPLAASDRPAKVLRTAF